MRSLVVLVLSVVAGCSARVAAPADAGAPCPAIAPTTGDPCTIPGQRCAYEHCVTTGLVTASCGGEDAGTGTWTVTTAPCGVCGGRTCVGGTVCMTREGGALITDCATHSCGDGPLNCECLCGAGVECTLPRYDGTGPIYTCRVGCGASVCP